MNFRIAIIPLCVCFFCAHATAADKDSGGKDVGRLIALLADENFKVREDAARDLWKLGNSALPSLMSAANDVDPEKSVRARDIARRIELGITPETDPVVIELTERYANQFELIEWTIGSEQGTNQIQFNEKSTNLELGFEAINTQFYNRNVGGVALISDGNYNVGSNPSYAAEKLNLTPVFTLAVGDTTPKRDHFVKNVSANDLAYLNNDFPVEVDIESFKLAGKSATVSILQWKNSSKSNYCLRKSEKEL